MSYHIGIATYIYNYNYGSALQAYALTEYICSLGYDASILDFMDMSLSQNRKMLFRTYKNRILCSLTNPIRLFELLRRKHNSQRVVVETEPEKKTVFHKFYTESMKISKKNYLQQDSYNAFVCGSDQVWKLTVPGLHEFFFLRFAPAEKRIAYAPSFGSDYVPRYNRARLKKYINAFPSISVREASGVEIIKDVIGLEVPQVLDPVLLVGCDFWREKYVQEQTWKKYILCYFLDENQTGIELVRKIATDNHIDSILWIASGYAVPFATHKIFPSPIDLVQLIDEAAVVITDSFHCMAFSALMNTDFYALNRMYKTSPEQATRIDSFLHMYGFESRRIPGEQVSPLNIDFSKCNQVFEKEREVSSRYLEDALAKSVNR